jgi:hypothetical protein
MTVKEAVTIARDRLSSMSIPATALEQVAPYVMDALNILNECIRAMNASEEAEEKGDDE